MSDIPAARDLLDTLADDLRQRGQHPDAKFIQRQVIPLLWREPPIRKAPAKRPTPMEPETRAAIRDFAKKNPHMNIDDIARRFNTGGGRVSEILNMKRGKDDGVSDG